MSPGNNVAGCDLTVRKEHQKRTPEQAVSQLEKAYKKWSQKAESDRGVFNLGWLRRNGFAGLKAWSDRHGGIKALVNQATEQAQQAFQFEEVKDPMTKTLALQQLEQAYKKWDDMPTSERGKFNSGWLKRNGFSRLSHWASKNPSYKGFLAEAPDYIQEAYNKGKTSSTPPPAHPQPGL